MFSILFLKGMCISDLLHCNVLPLYTFILYCFAQINNDDDDDDDDDEWDLSILRDDTVCDDTNGMCQMTDGMGRRTNSNQ